MNQLEPAYSRVLEKQDTTAYLEQLSTDAMQWWFNLDIPRITLHFAPLQELPGAQAQMPLRLVFIAELLTGGSTSESIAEFYRLFRQNSDTDAVVLAVGAGYRRILDEGRDLSKISQWQQRAEKLLQQQEVSPLARASLLGLMGYAAIAAEGNNATTEALFARQLVQIEAAGSISLKVYHAAMRTFLFLHRGDLSSAGILLQDVLPLSSHTDCSLISRLYLQATHGLYRAITGKLEMARQILDETVAHPLFDRMPPSLWLFAQSHRLLAYAYCGDIEQTHSLAAQIRAWSVPQYNALYHGYLNYSLGVAALIFQDYRKAYVHAEEAALQGEKCRSHLTQMMAALLEAQALIGLGNNEQAFSVLEKWYQSWEQRGLTIFASTAALEAANILASQNRLDEARDYFQRAKDYLPEGEPLSPPQRPIDFLQQLDAKLFPGEHQMQLDRERYHIRIQTLGEFKVEIGDQVIYDKSWHGGRSRLLLKLLIVYGGHRVSADSMADFLWPDSDGDKGKQNLKAVLWRLRRLGLKKGEEPLPWLQLENGQFTLDRSLCMVDAIIFEQQVKSLLKNGSANIDELIQTLDLYQGDFLTTDVSEIPIIEHRECLRQLFINGVIHLSEIVGSDKQMEQTLDLLTQARKLEPLHEAIHEQLMRFYLKLGFPAKALQSYQHAEKVLMQALGIQPGPVLASLANSIKKEYR